jgi:hypothetical protein
MGSLTRLTTFDKIEGKGGLGTVLGRLMLAVNDIGIANDALGHWMGEQTGQRSARQKGAKMYFVRILLGHIWEGLHIIKTIKKTPMLMDVVESCPDVIRRHFNECIKIIGTKDYLIMRKMRNDVIFHYEHQPVEDAILRLSNSIPDVQMTISLGDDPLDWYYEPGDRIIDDTVVKAVFEIPEGADISKEVDRLVDRLHLIGDHFIEFAGFFIMENAS